MAIQSTYARSLPGDSVYFRNSIPLANPKVHSRVECNALRLLLSIGRPSLFSFFALPLCLSSSSLSSYSSTFSYRCFISFDGWPPNLDLEWTIFNMNFVKRKKKKEQRNKLLTPFTRTKGLGEENWYIVTRKFVINWMINLTLSALDSMESGDILISRWKLEFISTRDRSSSFAIERGLLHVRGEGWKEEELGEWKGRRSIDDASFA